MVLSAIVLGTFTMPDSMPSLAFVTDAFLRRQHRELQAIDEDKKLLVSAHTSITSSKYDFSIHDICLWGT